MGEKVAISIHECGIEQVAEALEDMAAILRCPVSDSALGRIRRCYKHGSLRGKDEACKVKEAMDKIFDLYIPYISAADVKVARAFAEQHGRLAKGPDLWEDD